jgi:hypothetical protein
MYDHFRPPEHFTFWQALAYRLSGSAIVIAGLVLIAVYVMPWLDARYFSPAIDWFNVRFFAFFGDHGVMASITFFAIIAAPWAASHLYARHLGRKNRERASGDAPQ